ncbi:MAG: adenylate/guanylate cyclase domain-containing protein [Gammaproteobacteria bacterium]
MISSKELIDITGISRATLNNYVALGILPHPVVKTGVEEGGRATRLGFFEDDAVDCIEQVRQLKKQGLSMAEIAKRIGKPQTPARSTEQGKQSSVGGQGSPAVFSLDASIDNFPGPSYMVNNNFELIWWNDSAANDLFRWDQQPPGDLESRNLLHMLFNSRSRLDNEALEDLIGPHLAAGKRRLSQQALVKMYSSLDSGHLHRMRNIYDDVEPLGQEPVVHFPLLLPGEDKEPDYADLYICFYREGILFTLCPVELKENFLLDFLSKRNQVINELLKKRKPYLTNVVAMVADVQNSTRICSELPAEEYFELINSIWQQSEPIFRKYYGTYGKHVGDGMVYYFFPQPDCDYKLNSINCSLELQAMMKRLTNEWQARKGWFTDIFLNIGLNEGQEWFGSYHAGGHVEFTILGETINHASRISDFARGGSIWATKSMLNQVPAEERRKISFGITRLTRNDEKVFVKDSYASLGSLISEGISGNSKFRDIEMLPITEIRDVLGNGD